MINMVIVLEPGSLLNIGLGFWKHMDTPGAVLILNLVHSLCPQNTTIFLFQVSCLWLIRLVPEPDTLNLVPNQLLEALGRNYTPAPLVVSPETN